MDGREANPEENRALKHFMCEPLDEIYPRRPSSSWPGDDDGDSDEDGGGGGRLGRSEDEKCEEEEEELTRRKIGPIFIPGIVCGSQQPAIAGPRTAGYLMSTADLVGLCRSITWARRPP